MIYLGADHRGYKAKTKLFDYLLGRGYQVTDMGTNSEEPVDYPLIAAKVGEKVVEDLNNRGILLCGSGDGVCIVANKIKGVRAALAWNKEVAMSVRNDDNANILCLGADQLAEDEIREITQTFLDTSFGGQERYNRRIKEISDLEKEN